MKSKKVKKKKMSIILGVTGLAVAIGLYFGGRYLYDLSRYRQIVSEIEIHTPGLSLIEDGVYRGSFDALFISANVDIIVQENEITRIIINEHIHDRGLAAEVIIDDVILHQSLEVDAVSGATNSSRVILKAIQAALMSEVLVENDAVSSATSNSGN